MTHNKCLKYSLFWAATATAPVSTCNLDAIITSVDSENLPEPESTCINYGYLYNWYAATDSRKITSSDDWVVPNFAQMYSIHQYLGGTSIAGGKLKETGLIYWDSPNTGATNESGFNGRGAGYRTHVGGTFSQINKECKFWNTDGYNINQHFGFYIRYDNTSFNYYAYNENTIGCSIRLLYIGPGIPSSYYGIDGKKYRVILINNQYWLADNLAETKFRNGDTIPEITDNVTWAGLVSGARCSYDNNEANAVCSGIIVVPDPEVPENCDIFVPQGFSPSNNDGINDYFRVQNLDCYPVHKMSIFDRNGTLLYTRTNNYDDEPWDGKVGGIVVSGVTRTWVLEINGAIHSTGSVYVI